MEQDQMLGQQLTEVNNKVSSILQLLKGHELDTDDKGMVGIQNDHEKRIEGLEKTVEKVKWFLYGMSIPAGWGMIDIVQKIIFKH